MAVASSGKLSRVLALRYPGHVRKSTAAGRGIREGKE